ncbi:MAG: hypothetical protein WAU92_12790 [Candidatus Sulfotelmatobacter sp.]
MSRAVVGNRGAFFQRRLNLPALLSAQGREPESVLCSSARTTFAGITVRWGGVARRIVWASVLTIPASAFVAAIAFWLVRLIHPGA